MTDPFQRELERLKRELARELEVPPTASAPADDAPTPTYSECVIGYRRWRIDALGRLWPSSAHGMPWKPGANLATCERSGDPMMRWASIMTAGRPLDAPPGHSVPHARCACGFYCRRRLQDVLGGDLAGGYPDAHETFHLPVPGAVAVWGDLQVHVDGFRASHACVVALATVPQMPPDIIEVLNHVAARYGVPLVPHTELEAVASAHGTPLPDSVRPRPAASRPRSPQLYGTASPGLSDVMASWPAAPSPRPRSRRRTGVAISAYAVIGLLWGLLLRRAGLDGFWWWPPDVGGNALIAGLIARWHGRKR